MRFGWLLGISVAAIGWSAEPAIADPTACGGRVHEIEGQSHLYVSKAEATCPWAFTTEDVLIGCEGGAKELLLLTTGDGEIYGLNGLTTSRMKLPSIRAIWADNPKIPGSKVDMTPWMDVARSMC